MHSKELSVSSFSILISTSSNSNKLYRESVTYLADGKWLFYSSKTSFCLDGRLFNPPKTPHVMLLALFNLIKYDFGGARPPLCI